jgi:hypothetical protein
MIDYRPLMSDALIERLVQSGPHLDHVERQLPAPQREALVELQRTAADAYASGQWQVPATGETIRIPAPNTSPLAQQAQEALGEAYLASESQGRGMLKALMADNGLTPLARSTPASLISR